MGIWSWTELWLFMLHCSTVWTTSPSSITRPRVEGINSTVWLVNFVQYSAVTAGISNTKWGLLGSWEGLVSLKKKEADFMSYRRRKGRRQWIVPNDRKKEESIFHNRQSCSYIIAPTETSHTEGKHPFCSNTLVRLFELRGMTVHRLQSSFLTWTRLPEHERLIIQKKKKNCGDKVFPMRRTHQCTIIPF